MLLSRIRRPASVQRVSLACTRIATENLLLRPQIRSSAFVRLSSSKSSMIHSSSRGGSALMAVVRGLRAEAVLTTRSSALGHTMTRRLCSSKAPPPAPPARWTPAWIWMSLKEMAHHYYHGSKLLAADARIAGKLFQRMLVRKNLTRREHNLLVRVCADIARLIPLSFFVIVPAMEFALPFAIKIFPNLLPSTFEEKHQVEERRKKLLKVRRL